MAWATRAWACGPVALVDGCGSDDAPVVVHYEVVACEELCVVQYNAHAEAACERYLDVFRASVSTNNTDG